MEHILIVYYSRKGENYWGGKIRKLEKGNTEIVAEMIQKAVGGDLFEIDTVKPYSADYNHLHPGGPAGAACKRPAGTERVPGGFGGLRHHLCGISQLVGDHAHGHVHLPGTL